MTGAEALLCSMLSCGSSDLGMLDDIEYCWDDVLSQIDWPQEGLDFNDIMRGVFGLGIIDIKDVVKDRISELEYRDDLDRDKIKELKDLRKLNPDEDIHTYLNCIDTHVWIEDHCDTYRKYLSSALDSFERNTGFSVRCE